nr:DUF2235 domain-containing protein [uncultured Albidiferax sp.]
MANDLVQASNAANRDVPGEPPGPLQDCRDVIHISVFFDGTGNNKDADAVLKKWANPARMWYSADLYAQQSKNSYPIYISGLGTKFNDKATSATDALSIEVEDGAPGLGVGTGGDRRLKLGKQRINDTLRSALLTRAAVAGGKASAYATKGQAQGFEDVNKALGKHRLIKMINVSIFGFSRGAALARAFANHWIWDCEEDHGQLVYEGYPIRFVMMGLYDTVASFGLPGKNLSNAVAYGGLKGRDLVANHHIERVVHYVAGHELRFSFPVDLIRRQGTLASGNWLERTYPGGHSDVGGGYALDEQGVSNNYARIPLRDMTREAWIHGVRMWNYAEIEQRSATIFQERYEVKPETQAAFDAYCKAYGAFSGTIESQMQRHMTQMYNAYGSMHRAGKQNVTERMHAQGVSWSKLAPTDMASELKGYEQALRDIQKETSISLLAPIPLGVAEVAVKTFKVVKNGVYAMWISPQKWQMDAWKKQAADGPMNFVASYIHDSKVGFLGNVEPFSYFSQRGIVESEHSVQGWFEDHVVEPTGQAVEALTDKAKETAKAVEEKAEDFYNKSKKVAVEAEKKAEALYEQGKQKATQAYGDVKDKAGQAVDGAVESIKGAWEYGWGK